MINGVKNTAVLLDLQLGGGDTNLYPQVEIRNAVGTLLNTYNLTHIADGLYTYSWTISTEGYYSIVFKVYADSGHTVLSEDYDIGYETAKIDEYSLTDIKNAVQTVYNGMEG